MTKKDYIVIGLALRRYINGNDEVMGEDIRYRRWEIALDIMDYLCQALKKDNPLFNRKKFRDFILEEK